MLTGRSAQVFLEQWSTSAYQPLLHNSNKYLLSVFLPGEESPRHEETVQAPEVQPTQGGEAREEGQQRGLCYTATRQSQALQLRAQAQTHLKREKRQKEIAVTITHKGRQTESRNGKNSKRLRYRYNKYGRNREAVTAGQREWVMLFNSLPAVSMP